MGHLLLKGRLGLRDALLRTRYFAVPLRELLRQAERAENLDLLYHVVDDVFDLLALGRRDPLEAHALLCDPHVG